MNNIKGLTTDRNEFLSVDELKEYDYDFLNKLYVMFLDDEGALFNWTTCSNLLTQLNFHKKWVREIKPKCALEVGTHKGYYSYFMKKMVPNIKIHTFGINPESQLCVDEIHNFFQEDYITFYPGNSVETLTNFTNPNKVKFDLAWVDGGHSYECAYSDLINCARLEIPYILVDDLDMGEVSNAFQNFLSNTYDNESKSYKYELLDQSSSERRIACVKKIVLE